MGNRAIIKPENGTQGVYLHWNGGRDSVEPFLEYCKLKEYRGLGQDTSYGLARLTQVISNFFGGSTSIGVVDNLTNTKKLAECMDNGIYIVEEWDIVDRIPRECIEQNEYNRLEMLIAIDEAQPKREQMGAFLGAKEIPTRDLKIGDYVYHMAYGENLECYMIAGFGSKESRFEGIPYIELYGDKDKGYEWNSNNFIQDETIRIRELTDEYKRIKCENMICDFNDEPEKENIKLYIPERKQYVGIAFGDGSNLSPDEDTDNYIYISLHEFDGYAFEEVDGGQLDFNTKDAGYNNNICNAIYDVLDFIYGNECIEYLVIG